MYNVNILWTKRSVCPIYRTHGAYVGRSGPSVQYIGRMVPMWGGAVRLSYIQDAWCLKVNYLAKGQTINAQYYLYLLVKLEDTLKEKRLRKFTKGGSVLARQCPVSPGTCNQEETGLPGLPVSWSPTLFSGSGRVGLPPVPWIEKKIERSPFFTTWWSMLTRRPGWTDNILNFFWVAFKS